MEATRVRYRSYVAIGDSTTEGLMDPGLRGAGFRGWADRLAEKLARLDPGLGYANLAIRGRKLPQIRAEQLEPATALRADLASVLAGVNDILRAKVDLDARAEDLEAIVSRLRSAGTTVLLLGYPDIGASISFASSRFGPRLRRFNERIREIASRHGAILVDLEADRIHHPALWAPDRLHASPLGHERMADLGAAALGVGEPDPEWEARLPARRARSRPIRLASDVGWAGRHLAPWVMRRIRGVSSGDGVSPKRPELAPVDLPPG